MSAFTPLRSMPNNPIMTQENHSEQTSSVVFDPRRGTHFTPRVITGSVPFSVKTHFKPIKTNSVHHRSPEMFDSPAIKRMKFNAPMMPDF